MWQALISTAGGLALAIPAHLAYHFLSGRVRAIVRDMEWAGKNYAGLVKKWQDIIVRVK